MIEATTTPNHNVNLDSQKQLARLLAKENILIRIGNYNTAFFDVKNRVLGLPTWNTSSKYLSDLLIGHEVGHARWTPSDAVQQYHERFGNDAPFDVANVVEDIRIERLILNSFPGLISSFRRGYEQFIENDFFKIAGREISEFQFIDRLNLKGKLRTLIDVPFDEWEESIYNRCLAAQTYSEVLDICEEILNSNSFNAAQRQQEEEGQGKGQNQNSAQQNSDASQQDVDDDFMDLGCRSRQEEPPSEKIQDAEDALKKALQEIYGKNKEEEKDSQIKESPSSGGTHGSEYGSLISETQRAAQKSIEGLQENLSDDIVYVDPPSKDQIDSVVIPIDKTRELRKRLLSVYNNVMTDPDDHLSWVDFKKTSKQNVAILIKEFERRKAAFQYSRATRSQIGTIEPNRLHAYKFDDQIFKSITRLADAKNHGMMFFIDYSGSMTNVINDVIKQALQLAFFCKAVNIPFQIYGFTSNGYARENEANVSSIGDVIDLRNMVVFELLNSSLKKADFELATKEMFLSFRPVHGSSWVRNRFDSLVEDFGGTPLNETMIIAAELINRFRTKHRIQKMNTIFLTDGEGQALRATNSELDSKYRKSSGSYWRAKNVLRWGGQEIPLISRDYNEVYSSLVRVMKSLTGTAAICFYLPTGSRQNHRSTCVGAITTSEKYKAKTWYQGLEEVNKLQSYAKKRKERMIFIPDGYGYDGYFVLNDTSTVRLHDDEEFVIDENVDVSELSKAANLNRLSKAFAKHSGDKRTTRVFLTKFSEMIA